MGRGFKNALILGSSTGYGLASLATAVFACGASAVSVCMERPPSENGTASAGFYNLCELHRLARAGGAKVKTIVGDAFSADVKREVLAALRAQFGPVDLLVYSVAAPKRVDPATGVTYASALKPIGAPYHEKTIRLDRGEVTEASIPHATDAEILATIKVMGGEDWELWIDALRDAEMLSPGCRTVAYSYVGPRLTNAIYRSGTLGVSKSHLEATAIRLDQKLHDICGGRAWVSVQQALVSQASSAIPVLPLYISLLLRALRERNLWEGTAEQIARLFRDHLAPDKTPIVDAEGRIRLDDREMDPELQRTIEERWDALNSDNLKSLTDVEIYKQQFQQLFGFEVLGVDYERPVEVVRSMDA